jgi:hypothetical protein
MVVTIQIKTSQATKVNCLSTLSEQYSVTLHLKSTFLFLYKYEYNIVR